MKLFDQNVDALNKALDLRFRRHSVLASNIANADTPNYRAREVDFAGELKKALNQDTDTLEKTNPMHMDLSSSEGAHIVYDNSMEMGADGNNVDLDVSMNRFAENSRAYSGAVNLLTLKFRLLRAVVRGTAGGV